IRGQVIVNSDTDFPQERFQPGADVFVNRGGRAEALSILSVRFHRERPVIGFRGVDDVDAAKELAGAELRVPVDRLAPLPPGTFYWHDLIGCTVETGDGQRVGVVTDVEGTISGSRLAVETGKGELLV